jgi:hypothetical protein
MRFNPYDDTKVVGGTSLAPQSFSGSTAVDGSSVNTSGADNGMIYAYGAATSGSPSAATLVVTLQESTTGTSGWTNALDNTGTVIGFTLNCESAAAEGAARIEGLNLNRHQYLRAVITPAFTGGTSPAILGFAQIILGNNEQLPVDSTSSNT